jgi:hypothetical protein
MPSLWQLWRSGRSWTLRKRYSEFYKLHEDIISEDIIDARDLPPIPKKRWFTWLRWTNRYNCPISSFLVVICIPLCCDLRYDEKFTVQRRVQLQEYIRAIVKIDILVERSRALHGFLEINRSLAIIGKNEEGDRSESQDERSSFYYDISTLIGN